MRKMKKVISVFLVPCLLINVLFTCFFSLEVSAAADMTKPSQNERIEDSALQLTTLIKVMNPKNGHEYALIEKSMSWSEAVDFCKSRGGYPAVITSEGEQVFVYNMIANKKTGSYWLGASSITVHGQWQWVTGEKFTYAHWSGKRQSKQEGYLAMDGERGEWKSVGISQKDQGSVNGFICEWDTDKALKFDGQKDYLETGESHNVELPISIEAWVKPGLKTNNNEVSKNTMSTCSANIVDYDKVGFGLNGVAGGSTLTVKYDNRLRSVSGVKLLPEQWYHICVVYTRGNFKAYVNGTLADDFSFQPKNEAGISGRIRIGRALTDPFNSGISGAFFKGNIDNVRIWGTPLSEEQVMEKINSAVDENEAGLLHFWNFNEDSGKVASDIAKEKLDAVLYNHPERVVSDITLETNTTQTDSIRSKLLQINSNVSSESMEAEPSVTPVFSVAAPEEISATANLGQPASSEGDIGSPANTANSEVNIISTPGVVDSEVIATSTPMLTPSPTPSPSVLPVISTTEESIVLPTLPSIPELVLTPSPSPSPEKTPEMEELPVASANMAPDTTEVPVSPTPTVPKQIITPVPTSIGTNWTLQEDTTIPGDLYFNAGTFDLNGHKLIVKGNIIQTAGNMNINKGRLEVAGDYRIQRVSKDEEDNILYNNSSGYLSMTNAADTILVSGSFVIQTTYGSTLSAGTIEIKGDFIQRNGYEYCFTSTGTHKVVLNGTKTQTISFASADCSCFNSLDLTQSAGVIVEPPSLQAKTLAGINKISLNAGKTALTLINTSTKLDADTALNFGLNYNSGTLDLAGKKLSLSGDLVNRGTINVNAGKIEGVKNLTLSGGSLDLGGSELSIEKNVVFTGGTFDLNKGKATVGGDVLQPGGELKVHQGRLDVLGEYRVQTKNIDEEDNVTYSNCSGRIIMDSDTDYMKVGGDFYTQTTYGSSLSAGTLELSGNFRQINTGYGNFYCSGTNKVVFSGTASQSIQFDQTDNSYFNTLDLSAAKAIVMNSDILPARKLIGFEKISKSSNKSELMLKNTSVTLTSDVTLNSGLNIAGGTFDFAGKKVSVAGDVISSGNVTINGGQLVGVNNLTITYGTFDVGGSELNIAKDVYLAGGSFDLNKGKVTVAGMVRHTGGEMNIHIGRLDIAGDYKMQIETEDEEGNIIYSNSRGYLTMTRNSDYMKIGGSFITQSTYGSSLTAGTIELKGAFKQVKNGYGTFNASGTHKTVFTGTVEQNVGFDDSDYNGFNILDLSQSAGILVDPAVLPVRSLTGIGDKIKVKAGSKVLTLKNTTTALVSDMILNCGLNLAGGSLDLAGKKITLAGDLTSSGNLMVNAGKIEGVNNLTVTYGTLDLGGSELNVNGNLSFSGGTVDLNKGKMTVAGMVRHTGGEMNIHIGKLDVAGDYKVQIETQDEEGNIIYSNSRGYFTMTRASDYVKIGGNFVLQSTYGSSLTAGTMEFKGNFSQVKNGGYGTFNASGTHKVILNGTSTQNIDIDEPDYHSFNILDLTQATDIYVDPSVLPAKSILGIEKLRIKAGNTLVLKNTVSTLTTDVNINGGLNITGGSLDLAGKKITLDGNLESSGNVTVNLGKIEGVNSFTVSNGTFDLGGSELNVKGDLTLTRGALDLNKGKVTVGGMVRHTGGEMNIHIGKLEVAGDYKMQTETKDEEGRIIYGNSSGYITMTRISDYMKVGGDFVTQSTYGSNLTAGTMELKGNFIQFKNSYGTFNASGTHKVIFSGLSEQNISFSEPVNHTFNILDVSQATGILVDPPVLSAKSLVALEKLKVKEGNSLTLRNTVTTLTADVNLNAGLNLNGGSIDLAGKKIALAGDLTTSGNISINGGKIEGINNLTVTYGTFDVGGSELTVKGDVLFSNGTFDLNRGKVTIGGKVLQSGGEMNIHIGKLDVAGDYKIQSESKNEEGGIVTGNSRGYMVMTRNSDYVKVGGNFLVQSTYGSNLTAGTMEIKGNFTQKLLNYSNFSPSGTHKVILNGTTEQTVNFEETNYSYFNILDITQAVKIIAENSVLPVKTLFGFNKIGLGKNVTNLTLKNATVSMSEDNALNCGLTLIGGSFNFGGNKLAIQGDFVSSAQVSINGGSLEGVSNLTVNGGLLNLGGTALKVDGNLLFTSGKIDINGGKLLVGGNVLQPGGEMNIHMGRLSVGGDYRIQTESKKDVTSVTYTDSSGYLIMSRTSDYVQINGSFTTKSNSGNNILTAGTFEIKGDFTQQSGTNVTYNFACSGTHKAVLSGSSMQKINFESKDSHFNIIERTQSASVVLNSPKKGGKGGLVTVQFNGNELSDNFKAQLTNGTIKIDAGKINKVASDVVFATFDLSSAEVGVYDVVIDDNGKPALLEKAFTVLPGVSGDLQFHYSVPQALRPGQKGVLTIDYINDGNIDALPPVIQIDAKNARLRLPQQAEFSGSSLQVFDTSTIGLIGTVPPGASGRILVIFDPEVTANSVSFSTRVLSASNTALDWAGIKDEAKPSAIPADAWNVIWKNFSDAVGSTSTSYLSVLTNDSNYFKSLGMDINDPNKLIGFELLKAMGFLNKKILVDETDDTIPSKGLSMALERVYMQDISSRFRNGIFGRGWTYSFDISALVEGNGDVTVYQAGKTRMFRKLSDGTFTSSTGDYGKLTAGEGSYILTEKDGTVITLKAEGKLESIQDAKGNTIKAEYNTKNQLTKLTHSDGDSYTFSYNANGKVSNIQNTLGMSKTYAYDTTGEYLSSVTGAEGTTQYSYWKRPSELIGNKNVVLSREHALLSITFPGGTHKYFEYDDKGRLSKEYSDGNTGAISYGYDNIGRLFVTNALGGSTVYAFNDLGMPCVITDPLGKVVQCTYDTNGNLTTVKGPQGIEYNYGYNGKGDLIAQTMPGSRKIEMTYDPKYNSVLSVSDAGRIIESNSYDSKGNLVSKVDASGKAVLYEYDASGSMTKSTNRRDQAVSYTYDNRGLVTKKVFADGTSVENKYNERGAVISSTDTTGVTSYEYDAANRLINVKYPSGKSLAFAYDNGGRRTKVSYSDGYTVNYTYNTSGLIDTVTDGNNKQIVKYTYNNAGKVTKKELGNGCYTTYEYNKANQIVKIVNCSLNGSINSKFDYTYDVLGRITKTVTLDGEYNYGYDISGQLTSVKLPNGRNITYTYDAWGNRSRVTDNGNTTVYTPNSMNQYNTVGNDKYTYDSDGNMVTKVDGTGQSDFVYNSENKLTSMTYQGVTSNLTYDSFGNMISKEVNGKKTEYAVDPSGMGSVLAEYEGNTLVSRYIQGVGLVGRVNNDNTMNYYDVDNIGSVVGVSGTEGSYVNKYTYLPFGEVLTQNEAIANSFKYVGQWGVMDEGNGLYYMRARSYQADTGKFTSQDPIGINSGSLNFYAYCMNNPVQFVDPLGLDTADDVFGVLGAGATIASTIGAVATSSLNVPLLVLLGAATAPELLVAAAAVVTVGVAAAYIGYKLGQWLSPLWDNNTPIVRSRDPNDIIGPAGYGDNHWIPANGSKLDYTIHFENAKDATAPAQLVSVRQKLDSDLDPGTFAIGAFGFGNYVFDVPENTHIYKKRLDLSKQIGLYLDVEAGIDEGTNEIYWTLQCMDPKTGQPPEDALAGFLPPDKVVGEGQGFVTYNIKPLTTIKNGDVIDAKAKIVFDANDPIDTPAIFNTVDSGKPISSMNALEASTLNNDITLTWTAGDGTTGSGVKSVGIYVSRDEQPFELYKTVLTDPTIVFPGQAGHTYGFFTLAEDYAGYREEMKTTAEATTYTANVPKTITVKANPASLKADAASTSTITVEVLNEKGTPLKGQIVNIAVDNGSLSQSSAVTNDQGVASVIYTSGLVAGTAAVTASIGEGILKITNTATIDLQSLVSIVYGDVTGDKRVMANDYALIRDYVLKRIKEFPSSNGIKAADVSGDGKIAANDYALVRDYVLKRISKFPVQTK